MNHFSHLYRAAVALKEEWLSTAVIPNRCYVPRKISHFQQIGILS